MVDDEAATAQEDRQADALARALEREGGADDLPEDALEAAALLRYSLDGGELPADRKAAILEEVLSTARAPGRAAPSDRPRGLAPWRRWLWPAGGLAAAASVALALWVTVHNPSVPEPTRLPAPTAALLAVQLQAAGGSGDVAQLSGEMRTYRHEMYAALGRRYAPAGD